MNGPLLMQSGWKIVKSLSGLFLFALICYAAINPEALMSLFTRRNSDTPSGEWVGLVNMHDLTDAESTVKENAGNAVLHLKLRRVILTSLERYTGTGEVKTDQGETATFRVEDLSVGPVPPGRLSAFMQATGDRSDMQGSMDGTFEPGRLTLERGTRTLAIRMEGVLRHGKQSDADQLYRDLMDAERNAAK